MKEFDYLRPGTVAEACALRRQYGKSAVILNGGTDVVIQLREKLIAPDYVIDIKHIPGLDRLTFDETNGLFIGACVTADTIACDAEVRARYPFFADSAEAIGSKQVRHRATCVGNIVNASPLCDTGTPLYALDAVVYIEGVSGKRELPIREFITFVRKTALGEDELVTGIRVPYDPAARGVFTKVSRRKEVDLSTICGTVVRAGNGWRVALGAVAPTPVRLSKTEALLDSGPLTEGMIEEAAKLARSEIAPIDDIRASREYRLDVSEVIVKNALQALR